MRLHIPLTLSIFLAALLLIFLGGCHCKPLEFDDSLSAVEEGKIHYHAGDQVTLTHDSGAEMTLEALVKGMSIETEQTTSLCEGGCCENIHHVEAFSVGMVAKEGGPFEALIRIKPKAFSEFSPEDEKVYTVIECRLQDAHFNWIVSTDSVSYPISYASRTLHETLDVRGRTYHNVWEVPHQYGYSDSLIRPLRLWYAEDGGIVRIMQTDSTLWERTN